MAGVAVLVSGGLDSCVLVAALAKEQTVYPLYIAAGLAWEEEERRAVESFLAAASIPSVQPVEELAVPVTSLYRNHWSVSGEGVPGAETPDEAVFLPGRNILLSSYAAIWCSFRDVHQIAIGSLDDNPFPDASPHFFKSLGDVLGEGLGHPIAVIAPFRALHKHQIIKEYAHLPLELSLSCMAPQGGVHCGDCNKCHERQVAFAEAGVVDKTQYARKHG